MKKIPMRTCVVTGEKLPKGELTRIVRTTDGTVIIDDKGKVNGRGAYITLNIDVIEKAKKSKILDRKLEVEVPETIYQELIDKLNK